MYIGKKSQSLKYVSTRFLLSTHWDSLAKNVIKFLSSGIELNEKRSTEITKKKEEQEEENETKKKLHRLEKSTVPAQSNNNIGKKKVAVARISQ